MLELTMETRRMCPHCRAFITTSDRVCPYCNEPVAPPRAERTGTGGGFLAGLTPKAGYLTILILLINTGLYLASRYNEYLVEFGASYGPAIFGGQWYRLVTAGFLHGGLLHILMNSWVLFDLGAQVEEIFGGARMLVIYFVSTITGFLVSAFIGHVSVGASAALFGLVGAMIAIGTRYKGGVDDMIRAVYVRYLVYLLIFSLLPGVDMAAHIGGLVGGFGIAYVAGRPEYYGAPVEKFWKGAAIVAVIATLYCFLQWFLRVLAVSQSSL
jgi:rhomboid protease GluP